MKVIQIIKKSFDYILLYSTLSMLGIMVLVTITQVFSREFLDFTPSWSEELSRVLFVWISFLGIAYGFKEKLHIALVFIINQLPEKVQTLFDYLAKVLVIAFGIMLVYYGWDFTILTGKSTMPGTGMPSSVLYASIPVSGIFITLNGIELLFRKGMHQDLSDVS